MSQARERYEMYHDESLDRVIAFIQKGTIRCGRYAKLVKPSDKINDKKELFTHAENRKNHNK